MAETKMMKRIMPIMAVTAFALATGALAVAVNVTQWSGVMTGDPNPINWDATLQYWTKEAQQAGDKYAFLSQVDNSDNPMGIWSGDAHSLSALAETLETTRENLVQQMESSGYRAIILYIEQQTLIEACLVNINDKLKPHYLNAARCNPPTERELMGFPPLDSKSGKGGN
jgi:hypothetical protein